MTESMEAIIRKTACGLSDGKLVDMWLTARRQLLFATCHGLDTTLASRVKDIIYGVYMSRLQEKLL